MRRAPAAPLAFLLGGVALVAQTLLARELLVLVRGSELALGAILAAWLLLAGLGSLLAGRACAEGAGTVTVAAFGAAAALGVPAGIVAARTAALWLPVAPGAAPEPAAAAAGILAASALAAVPSGAWYTAAAAYAGGPRGPGRAYAGEAGGALAGGVAYTWWLAGRADALVIATAVSAAALLALAAVVALDEGTPRPRRPAAAAALVALAAGLVATVPALDLADRSRRARWPGLELAAWRDSRYGSLALLRRGAQFTLAETGSPAFSFPDPESAEAATHLPLLAAPTADRVLLAGGAVAGALGAALRHPVRAVDYLELDPAVVDLVRPHLGPELLAPLADPRARLVHDDVRGWLARTPGRYDAILLAVPEPATALANRFATREFFRLVRAALRGGGVAAFALPSPPNYRGPATLLRDGAVFAALAAVFPRVEAIATDPPILVASASPRPLVDPGLMAARLVARGIGARTLSPEAIPSLVAPPRAAALLAELAGSGAAPNTDLSPTAYFHQARHEAARAGSPRAAALAAFAHRARWAIFLLPALLLAAGRGLPAARGARAGLALAAFTTGAAALGLQYLVLFAYQTGRGMLFGRIGAFSGIFMGGLALGGLAALRGDRPAGRRARLWRSDLALAALPAAAALALVPVAAGGGGSAPWAAETLAALVALLGGAAAGFQFPLLTLADRAGEPAAALAGRYYALDLAGAAAGALLVSLWLLPLVGLVWSLAFLALLKAASAATVSRTTR